MRSTSSLAGLTLLLGAVVASDVAAQSPPAQDVNARISAILGIPQRADEIRKAGVPDSTVRSVLDILVGKAVPPQEVEQILTAERDAAREHGPTDNFGAFVQSRLDQGLRGRDLAAAIRAEHAARGKGHGDAGRGRRDEAGAKGKRPDEAGSKGKRPDSTAARGKRPNS